MMVRVARALVALGAPIVPRARRRSWREEWESEIWHYMYSGERSGGRSGGVGLVLRCAGALPHAIWIAGEEWEMDSFMQDVRFALRSLRRRPGFTTVAVASLALGIGGNTAVFSVVNAVVLRPLQLETADRLVWIWGREFNGAPAAAVSPPDYAVFDEEVDAFATLAAFTTSADRVVYDGGDRPVELSARGVSHDLLAALGAEPALGRGFTPEDDRKANPEVAMISYGLWGRLFGFDPSIVGTTIAVAAGRFTVVGILPNDLDTPFEADVWVPLTFGADWYGNRASHFLRPVALLREGVALETAQREIDAVAAGLEAAFPETNQDWYPILQDLRSVLVGPATSPLLILLAAIGLVLAVACANVASLLLARSVGRHGEIAVRTALGAPRSRIVRQLITESVMLSMISGLVGVGLAIGGVRLLLRIQPAGIPRLDEVTVDGTVLLFALALATVVGLVFGSAPAFGLAGKGVVGGLRQNARGRVGGASRARSALVGGEVAISFVLLVGALLLARSFVQLRAVDPGFDPTGAVALALSFDDLEGDAALTVAVDDVLDRVRSLPGVTFAGGASVLPFSGSGGDTYVYAEARPPTQVRNIENTALVRTVTEGYFETIGVEFERGRGFEPVDDASAPGRVVINETLAARLFAGEDPLGKRLVAVLDSVEALEIVGVVRDVRQFSMDSPAIGEFFLSARQKPVRGLQLIARSGTDEPPPAEGLRAAIWEVAPGQPLARISDLESMVDRSLAPGRLQTLLLGAFSILAVCLAGVGIYGVLAEGVNGRRREIGVRLALGARPSSVVREVVTQGLRVAAVGLVVGAVLSLMGTSLLASFLYGVGPRDPLVFALAPLLLIAVVLVSSWLPARQAARTDPVRALRADG